MAALKVKHIIPASYKSGSTKWWLSIISLVFTQEKDEMWPYKKFLYIFVKL